MTLRVTLEIIPHGDEEGVYPIGYMDISNRGCVGESNVGTPIYTYHATQFSDGWTILIESVDKTLIHDRDDGPWTLVRKVLELKGFSN